MRVGIFGGTFDPPHLGHLMMASVAVDQLQLDQFLFVPASVPPHKQHKGVTPAPLRVEMLRAATRDDPRFAVSTIELEREGPSYTVDTLRSLKEEFGPTSLLTLIIGADWIPKFHRWRSHTEILKLAGIAVLPRGDMRVDLDRVNWRATPLAVPRVDLSSTEVRARVGQGQSIRYFVPETVREIIEREGLYRS